MNHDDTNHDETNGDARSDPRPSTNRPTVGLGRGFLFPVIVIVIATVLMIGYSSWGWRVRPSGLPSNPPPPGTAKTDGAQPSSASEQTGDRPAPATAMNPKVATDNGSNRSAPQGSSSNPPKKPGIGIGRLFGDQVEAMPQSVAQLIEESKQVVNLVKSAFPGDPDAAEVAARLYFRLGETQIAEETWKQCLQLNSKFVYAYDGLGRVAAKRGDNERAIELFQEALRVDPRAFDTQVELAQALIDTNQMKDAVALLKTNVKHNPRRYRGYVLLGMAYMHREDYAQAKASYRAALDASPQHANACFGLASACARLGETEQAEKYMNQFRKLRAGERKIGTQERSTFDDLASMCIDTAASYTAAGLVCYAHQDAVDTELLCRRAARLDPKNTKCRQGLAWLTLQDGKPEETIRVFEELVQLEPENMSYPLQIARIHASTGRPAQGERFLRAATQAESENAAGPAALASFLLQQGTKLDEAVALARRAIRLDDAPAYYALLSQTLERSGNIPGAIEAMATAAERDPKNTQYQKALEAIKNKYHQ